MIATLPSNAKIPAAGMPTSLFPEVVRFLLVAGNEFFDAKDFTQATRCYQYALDIDRRNADALNNLGRCALAQRTPELAEDLFRRCLRGKPTPATLVNLAVAHGQCRRFWEAVEACRAALITDPVFLPAHIQLAAIFDAMGDHAALVAAIDEGLVLRPDSHSLLFARSQVRLAVGNYAEGWLDYDSRPTKLQLAASCDEYPEWKGEPLNGRTLLVCREQGIGDQIMFARYVEQIKGGKVVLRIEKELARLFADIGGVEVVTDNREIPAFDCWVGIGSLGLIFEPNGPQPRAAYLAVPDGPTSRLVADSFAADDTFRVGLCWRGSPQHRHDATRSMKFSDFAPLLDTPGCSFYSLQWGDAESPLPHLIERCHDWADTAAMIVNLDLVISVDTAVAHLAGAMGKRTLLILNSPRDWRWGAKWYESIGNPISEPSQAIELLRDWSRPSPARAFGRDLPPIYPPTRKRCRYGEMSFLPNDPYIGQSLERYGEYSEAEVEVFRAVLKPEDVVIDAGANIGAHSRVMALIVGPEGDVYAFEPQPRYAELLRQNFADYGSVHQLALGSTSGRIAMNHIPLDRIHGPGWEGTGGEFEVDQVTIDQMAVQLGYALDLNFLKIDVDGQELEILKGAEATLARCRPFLYVENDKPDKYPDLIPWLDAHGYRMYQHYPRLFNPTNFAGNQVNVFGNIVSAMLLCVPKERTDFRPETIIGLERARVERG